MELAQDHVKWRPLIIVLEIALCCETLKIIRLGFEGLGIYFYITLGLACSA
jgi:hypothetical protein